MAGYSYSSSFVPQSSASKRIVAPAAERYVERSQLHNPKCDHRRNKQPILDVLLKYFPSASKQHRALEIASGTGQHVAHFAAALPHVEWTPTEAQASLLESIAACTTDCDNVRPPVLLDVMVDPWPVQGPFDSVHATNITHIAPWAVTQALLAGAGILGATNATSYSPYCRRSRVSSTWGATVFVRTIQRRRAPTHPWQPALPPAAGGNRPGTGVPGH